MSKLKTAVIAVDVQYDYLSQGVRGTPEADSVIEPLVELARGADLVIASRNWLPKNTTWFTAADGPFPPHCVQKTRGAKVHPKIARVSHLTVSKGAVEYPSYSAFSGGTLRPAKSLEDILKEHEIKQILVGGLFLEEVVNYTALDANALGYRTIVPLDCAISLDDESGRQTLAVFRRAGVSYCNHWPWR